MDGSMSQNEHNIFRIGMENYQIMKQKQVEKYYLSETIKLSLITGPLYCVSANMQYLVYPKTVLISDNNYSSKFLKNLFPRTLEGITFKLPFKPTFYVSYKDCILNLCRQGYLGPYKGNAYRILYFTGTSKLKKLLDFELNKFIQINKRIREFILYSFVDFILNPLLFIESRYSIQNRKEGFRIYENTFDVIKKSWRESYLGAGYSIPRNFLFLSSLNLFFFYPTKYFQIFCIFLAHFLSYPILTIQRNIIYQSSCNDYFPRYDSNVSVGRYIWNNFGFIGFYRGFLPYSIAVLLWHAYVPLMAQAKFYKNIMKDDKDNGIFKMDFFEDDEYEEIEEDSDININSISNSKK